MKPLELPLHKLQILVIQGKLKIVSYFISKLITFSTSVRLFVIVKNCDVFDVESEDIYYSHKF